MRNALRSLPLNFLRVFAPRFLPWHALAILATLALVYSDLDWEYFVATQHLYPLFIWTALVGALLPILLPLGLLIAGHIQKNNARIRDAWMLAQAAALGWLVSTFYKVFTGRLQPDLHNYTLDISRSFQLGFLRHGIFWGWPSSHTTVAFSMAVAYVCARRDRRTFSWLWLVYAALIGFGVSMSIHWLSDAVAGVIIGSVCGYVVGIRTKKLYGTK